jgi:hypothetical protein
MRQRERKPRETRILFPPGSWIPVPKEVFEEVLPKVVRKLAAHLYIAMYERACRNRSKPFAANLHDLSEYIKCDPRTARRCIMELCRKDFVEMVYGEWKLRSRTDKPKFRVPLSEVELEAGGWVPVPRFLVTRYLPRFRGSLLLIILLYYQHLSWKNYCWPGAAALQRKTRWQPRTVYHALNVMGHQRRWERLGTGLPWPLEITYSPDRKTRRFSVRAVRFYRPPGRKKPVVSLTDEFAIHFGYRKPTATVEDEVAD